MFPEPRIALHDIIIRDRARSDYDVELLNDLAQSLLTKGQIHPIIITKDNVLVSGGRRIRAATILRDGGYDIWSSIWYEQRDITEADALILELEENFRRDDLSWQDQARFIAKIHDVYTKTRPRWERQQTAQKLGVSPAQVTRMINLASRLDMEIVEGEFKFRSIRTFEGAYQSHMRERERGVLAEINRRADIRQRDQNEELRKRFSMETGTDIAALQGSWPASGEDADETDKSHLPIALQADALREPPKIARTQEPVKPTTGSVFDQLLNVNRDNAENTENDEESEYDPYEGEEEELKNDPSFTEPQIRPRLAPDEEVLTHRKRDELQEQAYNNMQEQAKEVSRIFLAPDELSLPDANHPYKLTLGDCLKILPTIPDNSIHCIVSDPIWGIDVGKQAHFKSADIEVHFDDSASDLLIMIPVIVKELDRILVEDAHIYIFTDAVMMSNWRAEMEKYWDVRPSPLIWDKQASYAVFSERTYMASYEMCMFATKGAHILNEPMSDIFQQKRPRGDEKQVQTQKPVLLLRKFIENSTKAGEVVLDFMCGSGSTVKAALTSGRKGYGIEIDEETHGIAKIGCSNTLRSYLSMRQLAESGIGIGTGTGTE